MNGFADHHNHHHGGFDADDNFGEAKGVLRTFDAFPKTKSTYLTRTRSRTGSAWTIILILTTIYLTISETARWLAGTTMYTFSVEPGVARTLRLNLDIVVAMQCADLHINIQDASGDRILAGDALAKDPTAWAQWSGGKDVHRLNEHVRKKSGKKDNMDTITWLGDDVEDVHDYLAAARKSRKRQFVRTPKLRKGMTADACRIYGSLESNKVQGDFHITARGHGYAEFMTHLDHSAFNFTHLFNELSFGPLYPDLVNPLDNTYAETKTNFHKFQYHLSIVPTIYTDDPVGLSRKLTRAAKSPVPAGASLSSLNDNNNSPYSTSYSRNTIFTNQYAVTEQSRDVSEYHVPGIFVKYDIEPIMVTISEEWGGYLALLVRLVNVVSGVLVAGGWCYQLAGWADEVFGRGGRGLRRASLGVLDGRRWSEDEKGGIDSGQGKFA